MSMIRAASGGGLRASHLQQLLGRKNGGRSSWAMCLASRWQQRKEQPPGNALSAFRYLHTHIGGPLADRRRRDQQEQQKRSQLHLSSLKMSPEFVPSSLSSPTTGMYQVTRHYHSTPQSEKAVAIMLGLGAVSALSYAGASAVRAFNEYKASLPSEEELEEMRKEQEKEAAANQQRQQENAQGGDPSSSTSSAKAEGAASDGKQQERENVFATWFGVGVGAKYYEGGFEETMTRREAALILGVRESSPPSRIKDAHRKLLVLNHPDTGGSTYVAGKINEAKELLLKGRRGK